MLRTTLTVTNGTLNLATTAGLSSVTGDGTDTVTLIGLESDINTALDGLTYVPTANYNGPANLQVTTDLQADLLGFYEFEINGEIGNDTSPNGTNDGAVVGATQIIDGTRGNVLHLDGNDVITIPGTFGDPQSLTLAAWVQLDAASGSSEVISLGNRVILRLDETFSGLGVFGSFYDGSNYLTTSSNTFIAGTGWHHVAYTLDGTANEQTLYIDGLAVDTTNHATAVVYASGNSALGRHASSATYFLEGEMDDARIYDRALSAAEIQALAIDQFSDTETVSITVDPVNDAPTATGGTSQGWLYNEGVAALNLVDIVVSDVDSGETISATLTLADTGTGSLTANDGATYDGLTGIWTITDTVANVNTALANLEFNPNTNNDINTTINVHIEDAAGDGPADSTIDLDVTPFDDAPTATNLTQVLPYNEGDAVVALNDIVVTEVDTGDTITAILTLVGTATGSLSANNGATYDGLTGIWTITDTVANVNTALANVVFNPNPTNDVDTTITTHIEDALGTGPVDGSITLDVTPINDAPTATNLNSTSSYNEGDASVPITDIVVSDADSAEVITATLTLANTATGSLSANDGATYTAGTGVWTITGTVAQVNTA
ncbi:MAG: LamG domain-containing protein, partial [bacterium]|nr:LamG domain-containing protein [bacterium]